MMQASVLGEDGLLLCWKRDDRASPATIHADAYQQVMEWYGFLRQAGLPWIKDLVPAYESLGIFFDRGFVAARAAGHQSWQDWVWEEIQSLKKNTPSIGIESAKQTRQIEIPACYHNSLAPDLEALAASCRIAVSELIELHSSRRYTVYMLGFLPGFPYMASVDARIQAPRLASPRKKVPAGSIGIAGAQTGIYPFDSPGGWNIIARTPLAIWRNDQREPALFQPGDEVRFVSISLKDFHHYSAAVS